MITKIYRIEYPDGFGPHMSKYSRRLPHGQEFADHTNKILDTPLEDYYLEKYFRTDYHYCAFLSQNALLNYIGDFIEDLLVNTPGHILEITIDSESIVVGKSEQVIFNKMEVLESRIIL